MLFAQHSNKLSKVLKSFSALVFVLVFYEIIIRIFFFGIKPEVVFDPALGYLPVAGAKKFYGIEGFGITKYSAVGEIATLDLNGPNIVVLGDSHTEALQVNNREKYPFIAEKIILEKNIELDLHTIGIEGGSIPDYLLYSDFILQNYSPEAIVIQLTVNDFDPAENFSPERIAYFSYINESSMQFETNLPDEKLEITRPFKRVSALVHYGLYRFIKLRTQNSPQTEELTGVNSGAEDSVVDQVLAENLLNLLTEAYPSIPVIILALPTTPKIDDGDIIYFDPNYSQFIDIVNDNEKLILIDPQDEFNELVQSGKMPRGFNNSLPGIGHLNLTAHQIVGIHLAETLEEIFK